MLTDLPVETGAEFSPCRRYRHRLWRAWDASLPTCAFIGLNPSTADETHDDPTIRRCVAFARTWGFGRCEVLNLFGWRSTDPMGLLRRRQASREADDRALARVMGEASRLVLAWGTHRRIHRVLAPRVLAVRRHVDAIASQMRTTGRRIEIGTLGTNADGSPRHPLYLARSTAFEPAAHCERCAVIGIRNDSGRA